MRRRWHAARAVDHDDSRVRLECRTKRLEFCRQWLITEDRIGGLGFTRQHPTQRQSLVGYCAVPNRHVFSTESSGSRTRWRLRRDPQRSRRVELLGRDGVTYIPGSGFGSKFYNMTIVNAKSPGFIAVFPCSAGSPTSSAQNFDTGQTIASFVALPSHDANCVYSSERADYIVDYLGESFLAPISPTRILDTRDGTGTAGQRLAARSDTHDEHQRQGRTSSISKCSRSWRHSRQSDNTPDF